MNWKLARCTSFLDNLVLGDMNSIPFCWHTYRKTENGTYKGTTWQVKFKLDNVDNEATYKLRVALASASLAELQVYQIFTLSFSSKFIQVVT